MQFAEVLVQELVPPDSTATPLVVGDACELKLVGHLVMNTASTEKLPALGQVRSLFTTLLLVVHV